MSTAGRASGMGHRRRGMEQGVGPPSGPRPRSPSWLRCRTPYIRLRTGVVPTNSGTIVDLINELETVRPRGV